MGQNPNGSGAELSLSAGTTVLRRNKIVVLCVVFLASVALVALSLRDPSIRIREGMAYDEVKAIFGPQLNGI
jgi:hypothetical protein